MTGGFLDRERARRLMAEQGLDALVLAQPETIRYATGAFAGVATFWRRAGAAFVIVPADPALAVVAVVGDLQAAAFRAQSGLADVRTHPLWVATGELPSGAGADVVAALVAQDHADGHPDRTPRPATFERTIALGLLADILREKGLASGQIGLELAFVPVADFPAFSETMPHVRWRDCSGLIAQLRAIKQADEIAMLRTGAVLAAAGVAALAAEMRPGLDAAAMTALWRTGVADEASRRDVRPPESTWAYIAVGGDGFAPGAPAEAGDLVKIDVGCVIEGYSSDGGRTAILGTPGAAQRKVYDALHRAFDDGLRLLAPGEPLARVHQAVLRSMWAAGFTTYGRGHVGHGVGSSIWSEEWPFIAADATALAEPGMVLAYETPYYIRGLGGFIIEDQILITDTGIEVMAPSPRELIVCPV